jgi:dTDP-4-amino-4,6-dideoxygalactose transaminase
LKVCGRRRRPSGLTRKNSSRLIRLSKSCIGTAEKLAVERVLDGEFLGMGAEVQKFEEELSKFFGRPTICVVNGTAALHLSLQACGIGPGDEVLVPSLTYVASFQAITATGATPIACDVSEKDYLIDLSDAKSRITSKTRAVMPVHYSGGVGDLDAIYSFAENHKLRVIEDAAHAFGTSYKKKRIGSIGDIACFSFDGIKNITSGEGGCIVSKDASVLSRVCDSRLLGVKSDSKMRFSGQRSWDFNVSHQGWRYHMSDIMAAIGLQQLNNFPQKASIRQSLAKKYDSLFAGHPSVRILDRDYSNVVPHIYVIRIKGLTNRKYLQNELLAKDIQVGYHYQPNHRLTFFMQNEKNNLPVTESVYPELLTLPLHPDLTEEDILYVHNSLCKILDRSDIVANCLA